MLAGILIGFILFPILMFLIARRDPAWDKSNMMNMLRVLSHIAKHPSEFAKMVYEGTNIHPFWYIDKDEFRSVVKTRFPQGD